MKEIPTSSILRVSDQDDGDEERERFSCSELASFSWPAFGSCQTLWKPPIGVALSFLVASPASGTSSRPTCPFLRKTLARLCIGRMDRSISFDVSLSLSHRALCLLIQTHCARDKPHHASEDADHDELCLELREIKGRPYLHDWGRSISARLILSQKKRAADAPESIATAPRSGS